MNCPKLEVSEISSNIITDPNLLRVPTSEIRVKSPTFQLLTLQLSDPYIILLLRKTSIRYILYGVSWFSWKDSLLFHTPADKIADSRICQHRRVMTPRFLTEIRPMISFLIHPISLDVKQSQVYVDGNSQQPTRKLCPCCDKVCGSAADLKSDIV